MSYEFFSSGVQGHKGGLRDHLAICVTEPLKEEVGLYQESARSPFFVHYMMMDRLTDRRS